MKRIAALSLLALICAASVSGPARSQGVAECRSGAPFAFIRHTGRVWRKVPDIVVMTRSGDDRIQLVADAVAFWNSQFSEIGSGFRLGGVTLADIGPEDEDFVVRQSENVLASRGPISDPPARYGEYCGKIVVILGAKQFISFSAGAPTLGLVLVGIKGEGQFPFGLPNVARNVIAHELGHAIGLGHNSDAAMLMCGRPAPCRPTVFESATPRYFPLTDAEKAHLVSIYPADWPGN